MCVSCKKFRVRNGYVLEDGTTRPKVPPGPRGGGGLTDSEAPDLN